MAESIAEAYKGTVTPTNLMFNYIGGGPAAGRANGFPTAEDVAGAYGIYRLMMRIATEDKIPSRNRRTLSLTSPPT